MSGPTNLGNMKTNEWEFLHSCADRLEQAWKRNATVDLGQFLPPPGDRLRALTLVELIKTDLEMRWRRGQIIGLETYLEKFPELGGPRNLPATLVFEEYRIRHVHGDRPSIEVYRNRFPDQFAELQRLVKEQPPSVGTHQSATLTPVSGPPLTANTNPTGQVIGRDYKLIDRLGQGGFAEVWRAEAPGGIEVAIKIMFRAMDHAEAKREFQALELIKRLRHHFLLQTHRYWVEEGRLYIVMELADGSLRGRLKECRTAGLPGIPVPELLVYMSEAAEALDFLHEKKVLHRDIKPDNILLLGRHAKVADFGLARLQQSQALASATNSGTPAYMAPEMWAGKVSEHTDQYCLAVTYAELRMDRRLYAGSDLVALMMEHLQGTPRLDGLPQAEQEVLFKALSKVPDQRYPSCKGFIRALEIALAPEVPTALPSGPSQTWPSTPSRPGTEPAPGSLATLPPGTAPGPGETQTGPGGPAPRLDWRPRPGPDRRSALRRLLWIGGGVAAASVAGTIAVSQMLSPDIEPIGPGTDPVYLPPHCRMADRADVKKLELEGNRQCYDRIEYVLPDGTPIPFVLIRKIRDKDPRSFYIMVNKVSVGELIKVTSSSRYKSLLEREAEGKPWVAPGEWRAWVRVQETKLNKEALQLPIMMVSVIEAYCFAQFLGGNLPFAYQWDKAAGRFEPENQGKQGRGKGPFVPPWDKKDKTAIAVGRATQGPMPVGTASRDESKFRCRDMAGNGLEWTRNLTLGKGFVPLPDPHRDDAITLRGRNYKASRPLLFSDIAKEAESQEYGKVEDSIGIRVVIDLP
jgi:serine/threonine protein kinase